MALLPVFLLLLTASMSRATTRAATLRRTARDWAIDLSGLVIQGAVIPMFLVVGVAAAFREAWPAMAGSLAPPAWASFLACFVGVDALYWLNHRALHRAGWALHQVHHEAVAMDVLSTSRNTLWTSLLIVYLWADAAALWLLDDPRPWLLASLCSAGLDLWRHSELDPPAPLAEVLGLALVLPAHHARHHGPDAPESNFGANLNLWDRLAGTWVDDRSAGGVGRPTGLPLLRALLWPFP